MNQSPGYVYAIQMEGHPLYKIGRCNSVPRRMSEIGVQLPFPYRIIFARRVSNPVTIETQLHRSLAVQRKNGEWFHLAPIQVTLVAQSLLITQADELLDRLVDMFQANYEGKSPEVTRYTRVIQRANERAIRRHYQFYATRDKHLHSTSPDADVIEAGEVVQ